MFLTAQVDRIQKSESRISYKQSSNSISMNSLMLADKKPLKRLEGLFAMSK